MLKTDSSYLKDVGVSLVGHPSNPREFVLQGHSFQEVLERNPLKNYIFGMKHVRKSSGCSGKEDETTDKGHGD